MFYKTLAIKKIKFILFIILCGLSTSSHSEVTKLMLFNTDGIEQSMSDYIGRNKWVLVNVWSPSCSFCVQELPKVSLFKRNNPDVSIIAVTLDFPSFEYGRIEIIKAFLMKYPQNYPIFLADTQIFWCRWSQSLYLSTELAVSLVPLIRHRYQDQVPAPGSAFDQLAYYS